jgi:hypothetical protein
MTPDYSSKMLKAFLQVQVRFENRIAYRPGRDSIRIEMERIRRGAGVTEEEFKRVRHGWNVSAEIRTRVWAALGVYPGLSGWILTDDGGQMLIGGAA